MFAFFVFEAVCWPRATATEIKMPAATTGQVFRDKSMRTSFPTQDQQVRDSDPRSCHYRRVDQTVGTGGSRAACLAEMGQAGCLSPRGAQMTDLEEKTPAPGPIPSGYNIARCGPRAGCCFVFARMTMLQRVEADSFTESPSRVLSVHPTFPSFPRRRESRYLVSPAIFWIPACAGMT